MALIKCPECEREISTMATSCPHCGFPLEDQNPHEAAMRKKKCNHHRNTWKSVILSIIRFEWVDKVTTLLSKIPYLGCLFSWLFTMLCFIAIVVVGALFFCWLYRISPLLTIIIGMIGFNIIAFLASYVWHSRKSWFFWLCLTLTVPLLIIALKLML